MDSPTRTRRPHSPITHAARPVSAPSGFMQSMRRRVMLPLGMLSLTLAPRPVRAAAPIGQPDSLRHAIASAVRREAPISGYPAHRWEHVRHLYEANDDAPLWTTPSYAPSARATALVDTVSNAPAQGLSLDGYAIAALRDGLAASRHAPGPARAAALDVLLTATFVAYAEDLLTGQIDPRSVSRAWHIDPHEVDVDSALARTLRTEPFDGSIAHLRPPDPDYAALVAALARYRGIVGAGGWPHVPDVGVLRPGATATVGALGTLLGRLVAEGYGTPVTLRPVTPAAHVSDAPTAAATPALYDAALAGMVAHYQAAHGLAVDSAVGPNTRASMNRSAEYRARQIAANLERHRWMPHERGDRYVLVNVPAFRLRAYDGGREVLSMKVVVGAEYGGRSTPVFSDSMAYVVFRPYWNVPQSIASRELWPRQRRDPSYFERNGYEVVHASWGTHVRQRPGPDNALGDVKFIFPNDFNIYLHDTPARHLFDEDVRALSHGCIRVERPDALARFVLGPQGWDLARVRAAMHDGKDDRRVDLDHKLPVYIAYFTAYMRDDTLRFANDVYDRDDALVRAVTEAVLPRTASVDTTDARRD